VSARWGWVAYANGMADTASNWCIGLLILVLCILLFILLIV